MHSKKLKNIVLICSLCLLLLVVISTILGNISSRKRTINQPTNNLSSENSSIHNFNETIDLDKEELDTRTDEDIGTDNSELGTISDYYKNSDTRIEDGKIYLPSYDGEDIISDSWMNEGYAAYINEPNFGILERFILSENSITANFSEVKMKDAISYINEVAGLGFTEVNINDRNNRNDYYIYSALNGDKTFTLNYEKGKMLITVY